MKTGDVEDLKTIAERVLDLAKQQGASAEVLVRTELGFDIHTRATALETLEHHQGQSVGLSVYLGQKKGSASCASFEVADLETAVQKALTFAKYASSDPAAGLPEASSYRYLPKPVKLAKTWDISLEAAIEAALACEVAALQKNPVIKQCEFVNIYSYQTDTVLANSQGFCGALSKTTHGQSIALIAEDEEGMQREDEWTVARRPEDLMSLSALAEAAVAKTVARLNPKKISTRQCPVIFLPALAKSYFSHFFHAVDGAALYRKNTFLLDALDKKIFPDFLSLEQQPFVDFAMGARPFDDEGMETRQQYFVEKGEVKNYCLDVYSARKLQRHSTANAGGVFNVQVSPTVDSFSALLKMMGKGLLVTELMGQSVNLLTGHYSRGAAGFWVENGEIQFPVAEITIAGKLQEMFAGLVAVAGDIDRRGSICTGSILLDRMTVAGE